MVADPNRVEAEALLSMARGAAPSADNHAEKLGAAMPSRTQRARRHRVRVHLAGRRIDLAVAPQL
jgi:hypothetical protein